MKHNSTSFGVPSGESGVSLPETLVALLILTIGTVGVLSLFFFSTRLVSTGRDYALLCNRARDTAEVLLASNWNDPTVSAGAHRNSSERDHIRVVWSVSERIIDLSSPHPPGRETSEGNFKIISITAVAYQGAGAGRRDVTLVVMKGRD